MRRRLFTSLAAAAAVAASLLITSGASASAADATSVPPTMNAGPQIGGVTPSSVPKDSPIYVDETKYKIVATLRGVGKQVYDCNATGTYTFREPMAGLFTSRGIPAGIHGAGPFWADFDGSKFVGNTASPDSAAVDSPVDPTKNIKWLKVAKASTVGTGGLFSAVEFVQRVDTRGGVAPTSCTAPATASVDYTTNYVFWAPK